MSDVDRLVGIIKFYNPRKGFGFIARAEGNDVFFHHKHFLGPLAPLPGNVVQFSLGQNREGLTAENIVLLPEQELECYGGVITEVGPDDLVATTSDNFAVHFTRGDYLPRARANALRVGDEVDMHFVFQEDDERWWAKVVRAPDYVPESSGLPTSRRDGDDEEDNRRLLGILYKTDLEEEATHAARLLAERNMRATLSALVSRVFDRRLAAETRRELLTLLPQVYFDDECQEYLDEMARRLLGAVEEEDEETSPSACRALELLLDDQAFPMRWSQYLLPFGLNLLRNLSSVPSCHSELQEPDMAEQAERWALRVCRHVEQRRTNYGYVMRTALETFDGMWQRDTLQDTVERVLGRLLLAADGDLLAEQLQHLRDRLSPAFLPSFLRSLGQHPDLAVAVRAPAQSEVVSQWLETVLRGEEPPPTELLAALLPVAEEVRAHLADDAAVSRLMQPLTASLSAGEVVRMLTMEDLPERSVWACLRHLDRRGELSDLLGDPELRGLVTAWLRRTSEAPARSLPREQEVSTALHLIDSLRATEELPGELQGIGESLFADIHKRFEEAEGPELVELLESFELDQLPGLCEVLARRLADPRLSESALRRLVAWFAECGPAAADLAGALTAWRRRPDDAAAVGELIAAGGQGGAPPGSDAAALSEVAREALSAAGIAWHDGFVTELTELPSGQRAAAIQGFAILLPQRLFSDPGDFAVNRFVRLVHRRGLVLSVSRAPVPESDVVLGRLSGPLAVDERNVIVGELVDADGGSCYFEASELLTGLDRALQEGDLMRFTRVPAAAGGGCDHVAFNLHAALTEADLPLLIETFSGGGDDAVARSALAAALDLDPELASPCWSSAWARAAAARRAAAPADLAARLGASA
ncbi:MAG: cold shock domain-containing protein [Armatimonadetes bacterium]|nr:cold shock domain-containing protein [Armatimonadota bacterium]